MGIALRVAGAVCVLAIAVLSLIPGSFQSRTFLPGPIEHFIAYAGTALLLGLCTRSEAKVMRLARVFVLLSAYSALMEVLQHWSPGRDPQIIGFVASSCGAAVGTAVAFVASIIFDGRPTR